MAVFCPVVAIPLKLPKYTIRRPTPGVQARILCKYELTPTTRYFLMAAFWLSVAQQALHQVDRQRYSTRQPIAGVRLRRCLPKWVICIVVPTYCRMAVYCSQICSGVLISRIPSSTIHQPIAGPLAPICRSLGSLNVSASLADGRVLAVRGLDAEIFDPATDTWSATGSPARGGASCRYF